MQSNQFRHALVEAGMRPLDCPESYEMNYSGSHELVRIFPLQQTQGNLMLSEVCMADYAEDG
jgi:hypothetical protein